MHKLHQKIHHHLKLRHHKHTGKLLHHRHTSYRGLAVVLVLTAMAMGGVSLMGRAAADSLFVVQGSAPTPVPTVAASISSPADNATLRLGTVLVTGSCPLVSPLVTVTMLVDGVSAGSAACDANNDYTLPVSLSPGPHTLVAQTYTVGNQAGPASAPIHVTAPGSAATSPVAITTNSNFSYVGADKTATWNGSITGGIATYHVHIDWGDGTLTDLTVPAGNQHFSHTYGTLRSHNPLISLVDASGNRSSRQFAAAAYTNSLLGLSSAALVTPQPTSTVGARTLFGLYGLFITVLSVCAIVWLEAKHAARQEVLAG
ncbi:MAG TPA: hypothetical protein VLE99_05040 [Candidatus Saccharimonadales bacterium]|nr:hypothetical protein [Candidatus Saccharimonadales bacterium]